MDKTKINFGATEYDLKIYLMELSKRSLGFGESLAHVDENQMKLVCDRFQNLLNLHTQKTDN